MGANGAGKTTLMRMICGVMKPTSGTIKLGQYDVTDSGYRNLLGYLPQDFGYYPEFTGMDFMLYIATLKGLDKGTAKRRSRELLERVNLLEASNKKIKTYSGGMKQRLGIAQVMLNNPQLVVLDEPTNGLDPNQIVEIRNLIKELATDHAVMLSTHILPEVQATCDEIRMIEHGKVVFSGSMDDFDNYVAPTSFTATLVNAPAIEELVKLKGITSVDCLGDCHYRFHIAETDGITEKMIATSVANGWQLEEIQLERLSLDEIFARLSGKK